MRADCRLIVACLLAAGLLLGAAPSPAQQARRQPNPAFAPVTDDPNLPRVLLIGDSISIGYTPAVRELLARQANVHRAPTNCGPTIRGLTEIDGWLGDGRWDVIHFNFGLHDLKYVDDAGKNTSPDKGRQQVPPQQYQKNLRELVARMKKTGATIVFATTTPVPQGEPQRKFDEATHYNALARTVMEENGVAINDLHAFALPRLAEIQLPGNVHFRPEGSRALAEQVAARVLEALGKRQEAKQ